jgi:DMSO/TMAO reductase YedYZ molybdopterin-dependent catalytic subunit
MNSPNKSSRVVEARMKLKARFEEKLKNTTLVADESPMGNGKLNKHGMPEIPVGQIVTTKWPVLDLGFQPLIALNEWKLAVDGEIENSYTLDWLDFLAMPQIEDTQDFHCVTTWSKF